MGTPSRNTNRAIMVNVSVTGVMALLSTTVAKAETAMIVVYYEVTMTAPAKPSGALPISGMGNVPQVSLR
jgi:hypothetical protein